jgi:cysteinyl-tRNA synthetase
MKLYNTLTKKIEEFKPITKGEVGIYSCGPTVYWNQHIGHMYCYVQWDVLVRFFRYLGYKVKWVMNITDVGHMTGDNLGDADTGEDRMEKGAKREGISVWDIADKYIKQFTDSMELLNIQKPDVLCRATKEISEQIGLIKKIEANGFTYRTKTGLVFDTSKFPDYAKFARLNLKEQNAGARVEVDPEKKNPWDFLLWVTNQPEHIMKWESPWGMGFPGWHIECTAMSTKYLGETFDIHTGGKEHIPLHHTNEIAQGFGAFGRQTANYWVHNEWLVIEGEKMAKSLGNQVTAQDLVAKGYNPLAHRYLVLTSHYRQGLNFTWEALDGAQTALRRLYGIVAELQSSRDTKRTVLSEEKLEEAEAYRDKYLAALSNDLALPRALAVVWEVVKSNIPSEDKYELLVEFDRVLGLKLDQAEMFINVEIPEEVQKLLKRREIDRKDGKWGEADTIRRQIEALGYVVEDMPGGAKVRRG